MVTSDLSVRRRLSVVVDVARFRPVTTAILVGLNVSVAILSGVGVGFIVPIIEIVIDGSSADGSAIQQLFVRTYHSLGLPLTLETAIGGVAFVLLLRYALQYVAAILQARLEASYTERLRTTIFDRLLAVEVETIDATGRDTALNAIVTEARRAGNIPYILATLVQSVFLLGAFGAVAFLIAPPLAILTIVLLGGITAFVRFVITSGYASGNRLAAADEAVQRTCRRGIAGLRDIKLLAVRDRFQDAFERAVAEQAAASVQVRQNRSAVSILQQTVAALTVFALLYVGIAFYDVRPPELAAFLFAMFRAAPQVTRANDDLYTLESDLPHAVRIRELREKLAAAEESSSGSAPVPHPIRELAIENVTFCYGGDTASERVLDDVSFNVTRGETVALVGQSGAGKSTLAMLLARFQRPDTGRILVNGVALEEIDLAAWRASIGIVRQHPYIFDGTLRENLTLGHPDAPIAAVRRVCAIARIDEFVGDLPDGLDTELGEDAVNLSGGQRQRVAIARTLLTDPEFLVLDEATSELDSALQTSILSRLHEEVSDIPIVLIAHRESTVQAADRVFVLANGRIVERGTPEELRDQDGTYASLYGADDGT